jgi:WD40 repeat protein
MKDSDRQRSRALAAKRNALEARDESDRQRAGALVARAEAEAQRSRALTSKTEAESQRSRALVQKERADRQARLASNQARLARARALMATNPAAAVSLAARSLASRSSALAERTFLEALSRSHLVATTHASTQLWRLDVSGNGTVVSSGTGRRVLVTDLRTGAVVAPIKNKSPIVTVAFSPDGKRVAGGSWDAVARVWDASTGRLLTKLPKQASEILRVAFHSERDWLVSLDYAGSAAVWDLRTRKRVTTLKPPVGYWLSDFELSPDGERVLAVATSRSSDAGGAVVYSTATGAQLTEVLAWASGGIMDVVFGPAGRRFVVAGANGFVDVFDAASYEAITLDHPRRVETVAISRDDSLVATAQGKLVRIWDARTGRMITLFRAHTDWINALAFRADGAVLLSASDDGTARLWDTRSGTLLKELRGHTDAVRAARFAAGGRLAVTAGADATVRVWNVYTGRELRKHQDWVLEATFSPDGRHVLSGDASGTLWYWDARTGRALETIAGRDEGGPGHGGAVNMIRFAPDRKLLVTASDDGTAQVRRTADRRLLHTLEHASGRALAAAAFDPRRKARLVTASSDWKAIVWDFAAGKQLFELDKLGVDPYQKAAHKWGVRDARYSPDGTIIVTAGGDLMVRIWDATNGKFLREFKPHGGVVNRIEFPPGRSDVVATASEDGTVKVWNLRTREVKAVLSGSGNGVRGISFSHDGRWLLTADKDGVARVFDWRRQRLIGVMRMHSDFINSAEFAADGRILTASDDHTVKIYRCSTCGRLRAAVVEVLSRRR